VSGYCKIASTNAVGALNRQRESIRKNAGALKAEDPDAIHDVRVASRRLRSILSEYRPVFEKRSLRNARGIARQITQALGVARELDVSIALLESLRKETRGTARSAAVYVLAELRVARHGESRHVAKATDLAGSKEFEGLLSKVVEETGQGSVCVIKVARKRTLRRLRAVHRAYADWCKDKSDSDLHSLRIAFKKLRYACEAFAPVYGRRMDEIIDELKQGQEELGQWHDHVAVRAYIAQAAESAPARALVGIPTLVEAVEKRISNHLQGFALSAEKFFSKERQAHFEDVLGRLKHVCKYKKKEKDRESGANLDGPEPARKDR